MTPNTESQTTEKKYWVGFDLGGTKMLASVLDEKFKPLVRRRKKTKGNEGAEAGVERIIDNIRAALEEAQVQPEQLAGIGLGCAAPIDLQNGSIIDAVNLGWQNVPLRKMLEAAFGCPVVVSNDVDAGLYGEYRFGAGRDARCLLGVFPGTGIGGACVYEGRIVRGKRASAMEIGHVQVLTNGRLCGCGRFGCLETEGSRLAIAGACDMSA